jgi:exodeoxyribonuclease V alpha subunit
LLDRNLLYTAVTRGRRLVVVIGQIKALAMAVKRVGSVKRLTNLQQRLRQTADARAQPAAGAPAGRNGG